MLRLPVVVFLTVFPSVAAAECILVPFETALKALPVALMGRAYSSKEAMASNDRGMRDWTEFEVQRVWKGSVAKFIRLYQPFTPERIAFENAIGEDFVIFAREPTAAEREKYSIPAGIMSLMVDYCASKPAKGRDLSPLGKSRPPFYF